MFWLTRPAYLRWAAAALIVAGAFAWDWVGRQGTAYPFSTRPIPAGAVISPDDVEWRTLPKGSLPTPDLSVPVAGRTIEPGEPILPSALDADGGIPAGWWSVPITVPAAAPVGSTVLLLDPPRGLEAKGIVVAHGSGDLFAPTEAGLVAVSPEAAAAVAAAARDGELIVLVAP